MNMHAGNFHVTDALFLEVLGLKDLDAAIVGIRYEWESGTFLVGVRGNDERLPKVTEGQPVPIVQIILHKDDKGNVSIEAIERADKGKTE